MLDPNFIRTNPDKVKEIINAGRSKPEKANVDRWLELDKQRNELIKKIDDLRSERNALSNNIQGRPDQETIDKVKAIKEEVERLENDLKEIESEWKDILDWIPNMPISEEAMPFGKGEEDNVVLKAWIPGSGYLEESKLGKVGDTPQYMPKNIIHADNTNFEPKHHLDLGMELGVIDNEQAAKVAGTRFTYIVEDLALMQYAIQQLIFEELIKRGFKLVIPPLMVKERVLYGTSHFPEGRDQVYRIDSENIEENNQLFLVGSSEPSNFAFFIDKTVNESELPYKMVAYTPCFRSEVGSWGRDVRGIKRLHQFDKIEMDVVCTQEQSSEIFEELLSVNEWLLQQLEIPYHLVQKCTGDAGYHASARQIDPEAWLSGQQTFMEVGTDTNATDFQARRMNIKYKDNEGSIKLAHTVNDTAVAMGRMLIAIMDNYQQSDGSILVPKVLQKYIGKERITRK